MKAGLRGVECILAVIGTGGLVKRSDVLNLLLFGRLTDRLARGRRGGEVAHPDRGARDGLEGV
eukprot:644036-Prorocentrum_minimum.AAC.1